MFNKIIIAALAFAITANGIRTTNETSMSEYASCKAAHDHCQYDQDCCNGSCSPYWDNKLARYV